VGKNRSGTKWLTNILAAHPEVAGVQTPRHTGVLETNLFSHMPDVFGDLARTENYVAFIETWAQTDFFRASGVDRQVFYALKPRPTSYVRLFEVLMRRVAAASECRFWIQKASPLHAGKVVRELPDAILISIERAMIPNIESELELARSLGHRSSATRSSFLYVFQQRLLKQIVQKRPAFQVKYEDLRANTEDVVLGACEHIGIPYDPDMLESRFEANTSFKRGERVSMSSGERRIANAVALIASGLPLTALRAAYEYKRNRQPGFVRGTFADIVERNELE
jgi:hypothetical protein